LAQPAGADKLIRAIRQEFCQEGDGVFASLRVGTYGLFVGFVIAGTARGDWLIRTYRNPSGSITNLGQADLLIGGSHLASGFPATLNLSGGLNTTDNGFVSGPFGTGAQLAGLPPGENHDFAVQSRGSFTVATAGSYVFTNYTDDGSRLRLSVNGGPAATVVFDDVLSEPHAASSGPISLPAGAHAEFEWTWFNRSGPGLGKTYYARNGGPIALLGNAGQGLTPDTPSYAVRTYKSDGLPGTEINNFADADSIRGNPRYLVGSTLRNVFNMVQTGAGGDFPNDDPTPGLPGPSAADDFVVEGMGMLVVTPVQAGRYIFRSNTDDGARLRLDLNRNGVFEPAETLINDPEIAYGRNTDSALVSLSAGMYRMEFTWFNHPGPAEGEVSARLADFPSQFELLGTTLDVIQSLPGDANFDGTVNATDFQILFNNFGKPGDPSTGDFNGDAKVTFADFQILERNFGKSTAVPASLAGLAHDVPEPLGLAAVPCLLLACCRGRRRTGDGRNSSSHG
jgi:hypothetical protein